MSIERIPKSVILTLRAFEEIAFLSFFTQPHQFGFTSHLLQPVTGVMTFLTLSVAQNQIILGRPYSYDLGPRIGPKTFSVFFLYKKKRRKELLSDQLEV